MGIVCLSCRRLANYKELCKRCRLAHSVGQELHFFGHSHVEFIQLVDVKCEMFCGFPTYTSVFVWKTESTARFRARQAYNSSSTTAKRGGSPVDKTDANLSILHTFKLIGYIRLTVDNQ